MTIEEYKTLQENLRKNRGRNQFGEAGNFRSEVESVLKKSPDAVPLKMKRTQPIAGAMNRWESRYAEHLSMLKAAGEVKWFGFETIKLRLAKATFYTPDFLVVPKEGPWECHEVKGFWRDDARVKLKVAVEHFPFVFVVVRLSEGRWISERF